MGQGPADWRYSLTFKQTNSCNVAPQNGLLGVANAKLITPGSTATSIVSLRMHSLSISRMPALGTVVVDTAGTALVDQWINSLTGCPP
jgi:hypothetical protein